MFERVFCPSSACRGAVPSRRSSGGRCRLDHPDGLRTGSRGCDADITTQVVDEVAAITDRYALFVDERLSDRRTRIHDGADRIQGTAARID